MTVDGERRAFDALASLYAISSGALPSADEHFFADVVRGSPRPVVEVGIGTGRLARSARPDVGVDFSDEMLKHAGSAVPSATLLLSDLADYELDEPAALTYAGGYTLETIVDDEHLARVFENIASQTRPRGKFAFDALAIGFDEVEHRSGCLMVSASGPGFVVLTVQFTTCKAQARFTQRHVVEFLDQGGIVTERRYFPPYEARVRSPRELEQLATNAGWRVLARYGGYRREPVTEDSRRHTWILELA